MAAGAVVWDAALVLAHFLHLEASQFGAKEGKYKTQGCESTIYLIISVTTHSGLGSAGLSTPHALGVQVKSSCPGKACEPVSSVPAWA